MNDVRPPLFGYTLMRTKDRALRLWRLYTYRLWLAIVGIPRVPFPVVANSVPKAGSHLLARTLELLGLIYNRQHVNDFHPRSRTVRQLNGIRPGEFLTAHLSYAPEWQTLLNGRGARMVVIIRDPRDIVVSHYHYVTYMDKSHRLRPYYLQMQDDDERLMASITGFEPPDGNPRGRLLDINTRFRAIWQWRAYGAHVVRFEDLVGPHGGGDEVRQMQALEGICKHLDITLSPREMEDVARRLFYRRSATFRKGVIGDWRQRFTEEHKRVFKSVAGVLLVELGYERDENW